MSELMWPNGANAGEFLVAGKIVDVLRTRFEWIPALDITAYELALCVLVLALLGLYTMIKSVLG